MASIVFNWRHLAVVHQQEKFYKIYGRLKEIGLLEVEAVSDWLKEFGFDVLLGMGDRKYMVL